MFLSELLYLQEKEPLHWLVQPSHPLPRRSEITVDLNVEISTPDRKLKLQGSREQRARTAPGMPNVAQGLEKLAKEKQRSRRVQVTGPRWVGA